MIMENESKLVSEKLSLPFSKWIPKIDVLQSDILSFAQRHNLILVYLFGSYARGDNTPLSDLDIAVLLSTDLGKQVFSDKTADCEGSLPIIFNG